MTVPYGSTLRVCPRQDLNLYALTDGRVWACCGYRYATWTIYCGNGKIRICEPLSGLPRFQRGGLNLSPTFPILWGWRKLNPHGLHSPNDFKSFSATSYDTAPFCPIQLLMSKLAVDSTKRWQRDLNPQISLRRLICFQDRPFIQPVYHHFTCNMPLKRGLIAFL